MPGGRNGGRTVSQSSFNLLMALATAVAGAAAFILAALFVRGNELMAKPLNVGIQFGLLTLVLLIVIWVVSALQRSGENAISFLENPVVKAAAIAACSVLIALLAALFQWLYSLNGAGKVVAPTSYVFVIDDSGSMSGNDPEQKRYSAIDAVMRTMPSDFPYMIYGFSDSAEILREMGPAYQGSPAISGKDSGGTSIRGTLQQVIADHDQGVWDGGEAPRVILLTDGYATDMILSRSINKVLDRYAASSISISTVGLGSVDEALMKKIAQITGGVFIDVSNASDLSASLSQAVTRHAQRNLLSYRYAEKYGWLYGCMRVFFLLILGALIGGAGALLYGSEDSMELSLLSSAAKSLLGGLAFELFTAAVHFSDTIMQLILWVLIAVLLCMKVSKFSNRGRSELLIA